MIYSITEGQQAEEYKARKAKEAEDVKRTESERFTKGRYSSEYIGDKFKKHPNRRDIIKNAYDDNDPDGDNYEKTIGEDNRRRTKGWNAAIKAVYDGKVSAFGPDRGNQHVIADVKNRHMRRHPDQYKESCGIFSSVAFI